MWNVKKKKKKKNCVREFIAVYCALSVHNFQLIFLIWLFWPYLFYWIYFDYSKPLISCRMNDNNKSIETHWLNLIDFNCSTESNRLNRIKSTELFRREFHFDHLQGISLHFTNKPSSWHFFLDLKPPADQQMRKAVSSSMSHFHFRSRIFRDDRVKWNFIFDLKSPKRWMNWVKFFFAVFFRMPESH